MTTDTVAEMWREEAERRQKVADEAWKLVRRAAPFVNAVLCMTIEKSRADGVGNLALAWIADAGSLQEEITAGEEIAAKIRDHKIEQANEPDDGTCEHPSWVMAWDQTDGSALANCSACGKLKHLTNAEASVARWVDG